MRRAMIMVAVCGAGLAACTPAPVPVLGQPGPQKDPAAFQREEADCRRSAAEAVFPGVAAPGTKPAPPAVANTNAEWSDFFAAYAKCQAAHGNAVVPVTWPLAYAAFLGGEMPFGPPGPVYQGQPGPPG